MSFQETVVEYIRVLQNLGQRDVTIKMDVVESLRDYAAKGKKKSSDPSSGSTGSGGNQIAQKTKNSEDMAELPDSLEKLRVLTDTCQKCPHLVKARKNVVFGIGNPQAQIMFIGEAPGADEDKQGEPFVGRAGQLLTKMIQAMGLSRKDVFIGNVLKCRPDMPVGSTGNRKPTYEEMATCLPYLKKQISLIRPKVMVTLGATAFEGLMSVEKVTLSRVRGSWHEFDGIPLMPTYHPAYLLRNASMEKKREVWEDLLKVMEKVGMDISEKQRNFFKR